MEFKRLVIRKMAHLLGGFFLVVFYWAVNQNYGEKTALLIFFLFLLSLLLFDYLRLTGKIAVPGEKEYAKEPEKKGLNAATYFIMAVLVCFIFFEFKIALTALAMLLVAEPVAALVGKKWGRYRIPRLKKEKNWEGVLAGFAANLTVGLLIWPSLILILPMALVASLVEPISYKIDDNLTVPVLSGLVGQLITLLV